MADITAKVYKGSDPTTLVADLEPGAFGYQWYDPYIEVPGSGQVQIAKDHPSIAATLRAVLRDNNIVRCSIGGVEKFAFIVKGSDKPPAPTDEEAGEVWTLKGAGVLSILNNALVHPELAGTNPNDRSFGWMAISYDDSGWTSPELVQRQDDTGPVTDWHGYPTGWPDHLAYWLASRPLSGGAMPAGRFYFRKTFTLSANTPLAFLISCDNAFRLFLDDVELIDNLSADPSHIGWNDPQRFDKRVPAGTHTIAVECLNERGSTFGAGPAGLIMSVIETTVGGKLTSTIVARTDSSWVANDYPADPPGQSPAEILRLLLAEAQARGALVGVTLDPTITDSVDSNGNAWGVVPDIAFPVGSTYLDALKVLMEQYIDADMSPTLVLKAYNKGTQGVDRTSGPGAVSLVVGRDDAGVAYLESLDSQRSGPVANVIYARDATGTLSEHVRTIGVDDVRIERYIEMGTAPSGAQATRASQALLTDYGVPQVSLPGRVTEESGVYDTWGKGDTILAPGQMDELVPTTVKSITMAGEDDAGNPIFDVEFLQDDSLTVGS